MAISQEMVEISATTMSLKITHLKSELQLPGADQLIIPQETGKKVKS